MTTTRVAAPYLRTVVDKAPCRNALPNLLVVVVVVMMKQMGPLGAGAVLTWLAAASACKQGVGPHRLLSLHACTWCRPLGAGFERCQRGARLQSRPPPPCLGPWHPVMLLSPPSLMMMAWQRHALDVIPLDGAMGWQQQEGAGPGEAGWAAAELDWLASKQRARHIRRVRHVRLPPSRSARAHAPTAAHAHTCSPLVTSNCPLPHGRASTGERSTPTPHPQTTRSARAPLHDNSKQRGPLGARDRAHGPARILAAGHATRREVRPMNACTLRYRLLLASESQQQQHARCMCMSATGPHANGGGGREGRDSGWGGDARHDAAASRTRA